MPASAQGSILERASAEAVPWQEWSPSLRGLDMKERLALQEFFRNTMGLRWTRVEGWVSLKLQEEHQHHDEQKQHSKTKCDVLQSRQLRKLMKSSGSTLPHLKPSAFARARQALDTYANDSKGTSWDQREDEDGEGDGSKATGTKFITLPMDMHQGDGDGSSLSIVHHDGKAAELPIPVGLGPGDRVLVPASVRVVSSSRPDTKKIPDVPFGIQVTGPGRRVKAIALPGNAVRGRTWGKNLCRDLSALEILDLSQNQMAGGKIQSTTFEAPLRILNLSFNLFKGHIPENVVSCRTLEVLRLGTNEFSGPLPVSPPCRPYRRSAG